MVDIEYLIKNLPENCRVAMRLEHGSVVSVRMIAEDEHIATINALIDIAKSAGYKIENPGEKHYN